VTAVSQLGISSPVCGVIGGEVNYNFTSHRVIFTPAINYSHLLTLAAPQTAMVYDSAQKRCWLVPKIGLLLYMAQVYQVQCVGNGTQKVPRANAYKTGNELLSQLADSGDNIVTGEGDQDPFRFRHLRLGLEINIQQTVQLNRPSKKRKLYGFQLLDVVTQPGNGSCMRELDSNPSGKVWYDLANAIDCLVVCAGLGDAIVAASSKKTKCSTIPHGLDYLAAMTPCLHQLTMQQGDYISRYFNPRKIKLTEKHGWDLKDLPVLPCSHEVDNGECWEKQGAFQSIVSVQEDEVPDSFALPSCLEKEQLCSEFPDSYRNYYYYIPRYLRIVLVKAMS
jgi:hypothetical protein